MVSRETHRHHVFSCVRYLGRDTFGIAVLMESRKHAWTRSNVVVAEVVNVCLQCSNGHCRSCLLVVASSTYLNTRVCLLFRAWRKSWNGVDRRLIAEQQSCALCLMSCDCGNANRRDFRPRKLEIRIQTSFLARALSSDVQGALETSARLERVGGRSFDCRKKDVKKSWGVSVKASS